MEWIDWFLEQPAPQQQERQEQQPTFWGLPRDFVDGAIDDYNNSQLAEARQRFEGTGQSYPGYLMRNAIPGATNIFNALEQRQYNNARARFEQGSPEAQDYDVIAEFERHQQEDRDVPAASRFIRDVTNIGRYGAEFLMTGPAFRAGSGAAQAGAQALGITGMALRGIGLVGGATARAVANVPALLDNIEESRLTEDGVRDFWDAIPAGAFDSFTEAFTESLGSTRAFRAVSGAIGNTVSRATGAGLARLGVQETTDLIQRGIANRWHRLIGNVPAANRLARDAGWNGLISELLEERTGEVMRGAVLGDDFGAVGHLARGEFGKFLDQMLWEGAAFSIYGGAMKVGGDLRQAGRLPRPGSELYQLGQQEIAGRLLLSAQLPNEQAIEAEQQRLQPYADYYGVDPENLDQYLPEQAELPEVRAGTCSLAGPGEPSCYRHFRRGRHFGTCF